MNERYAHIQSFPPSLLNLFPGGPEQNQCSRLKPSYESHFEGLSNFSPSVKGLVQNQDINPRIQKWNKNLCQTCAWIIWYMFLVRCEEWRINHLTPLLVVTMPYACWFLWWPDSIEDFKWRPRFQFGVAFQKVGLREVYIEGLGRVWRALKTSILNTELKGTEWHGIPWEGVVTLAICLCQSKVQANASKVATTARQGKGRGWIQQGAVGVVIWFISYKELHIYTSMCNSWSLSLEGTALASIHDTNLVRCISVR